MLAPSRYVFIKLDEPTARRELYAELSLYGDVRVMSRLSEMVKILGDLLEEEERRADQSSSSYSNSPVTKVNPSSAFVSPPPSSLQDLLFRSFSSSGVVKDDRTMQASMVVKQPLGGFHHEMADGDGEQTAKDEADMQRYLDNYGGEGSCDTFTNGYTSAGTSRHQGRKRLSLREFYSGRTHIKCGLCDSELKLDQLNVTSNFNRHIITHLNSMQFHCPMPGCPFTHRNRIPVTKHIETVHKVKRQPVNILTDRDPRSVKFAKDWHAELLIMQKACFPDYYGGAVAPTQETHNDTTAGPSRSTDNSYLSLTPLFSPYMAVAPKPKDGVHS